MSLGDKVKKATQAQAQEVTPAPAQAQDGAQAQAQEVAPTPTPTTTPAPTPKKGLSADIRGQNFRNSGRKARESMTEDARAAEGSKSKSIAFLRSLGDPMVKQASQQNNVSVPSNVVVGYLFKALEPMKIPNAPLKKGCTSKKCLDVAPAADIDVKANEEFALNLVETAMLMSRPEIAGHISGGDKEAVLGVKFSADREEPMPILGLAAGQGSIKVGMELIANVSEGANGRKYPTIKPQYAKAFGVLYERNSISKNAGGGANGNGNNVRKPGDSARDIAAAFRQFYASKK